VHAYVSFIFDLARFHHRSPDRLGPPELERWLAHLIGERKLSASSVNIAINSLRSFYGGRLRHAFAVAAAALEPGTKNYATA
jgi:site-specific recombinase XerD